jgi:hypothetical protein
MTSPQSAAWGAALDHTARCGNVCELTQVFCTELNARTNANVRLGGNAVGKPAQLFLVNRGSGKPNYGLILSECTPQGIETTVCDLLRDTEVDDDFTLNEDEFLTWKYSKGRCILKGSSYSLIGDD